MTSDELGQVILVAVDRALGRERETRAALESRLAVLEARLASVTEHTKGLPTLGERVAGLEARPSVPGPAGADGAPGAPGADGVGFGDLVLEQVGDRDLLVKAVAGARVQELGRVSWPVVLDAGVWAAGRVYVKGDAVTYGGSLWICQQAGTTARPETADGARAWRLAVKRGRDGRGTP